MDVTTPGQLTEQVRAAYRNTANPRLRELLGALITHLHAFVAETGLTPDEWLAGLKFLTAVGHTCDSERPLLRSGSGPPGDSTMIVMDSAGLPGWRVPG